MGYEIPPSKQQKFALVQTTAFSDFFTPSIIAELDAISADLETGGPSFSLEEVRSHFASKLVSDLR
ncbi:MAG: hypothetical protein JST51_08435 [Armatimonadetes bacterium]|nr:hypothetical protein [Armatimonadota bacterium]